MAIVKKAAKKKAGKAKKPRKATAKHKANGKPRAKAKAKSAPIEANGEADKPAAKGRTPWRTEAQKDAVENCRADTIKALAGNLNGLMKAKGKELEGGLDTAGVVRATGLPPMVVYRAFRGACEPMLVASVIFAKYFGVTVDDLLTPGKFGK